MGTTDVFIAPGEDRRAGLTAILAQYDTSVFGGADVLLKANFNSADPFPASTHIDTVETIAAAILAPGPASLTLAERSGKGPTGVVLEERGLFAPADWLVSPSRASTRSIAPAGRWSSRPASTGAGFFHRPGCGAGRPCRLDLPPEDPPVRRNFTLSLRNPVGLIAKRVPGIVYDFMTELHTFSHQRKIIPEINRFYRTGLVVMDASGGIRNRQPGP